MKKIFYALFIFLCLFYVENLSAKTIKDVACFYRIVTSSQNPEFMTVAKVQIVGYNNGSGGSVKVEYINSSGEYVEYSGPTLDWQNYGRTESYYNAYLNFKGVMNDGYISNYKKTSSCPSIIGEYGSAGDTSTVYIESGNGDPQATVWEIRPYDELLKGDEGRWQDKEDFYKAEDTGETTVKDDLVCTYKMYFDRYNISTNVEFITMYDPADNNKKSYKFKVGEISTVFTDLNEDVSLDLRQGHSHLVHVTSDQLKKIFLDKCLPGEKVYHYYEMSREGYIITTDKQEAEDNGVAGRHDNGDGSNDGQAGATQNSNQVKDPNLDIGGGNMTCEELVGSNLVKVIKFLINLIRIVGVIASILLAMINLIPAVTSGDASALNAAIRKCIWIAVALIIIAMFPVILKVIGNLFDFDLSCIF